MISNKDNQLAELSKVISNKDEQLIGLINSKSWRYTKAFRLLLHKLFTNAFVSSKIFSRCYASWQFIFKRAAPLMFMVFFTTPVRYLRSLYTGRFSMAQYDLCSISYPFSNNCAVVYLARGKTSEEIHSIERFIDSYIKFEPGLEHKLYIVFKGFENEDDLSKILSLVEQIPHEKIELGDRNFDIGAYISASKIVTEEKILFLNTHSEILRKDWLLNIAKHLDKENIALVGCTASLESLNIKYANIPKYPNAHIRTNAFMTYRELFITLTKGDVIIEKIDAFHFESGQNSLTNRIHTKGYKCVLAGANGVGYMQSRWSASQTFRLSSQRNLIIADNQTRNFEELSFVRKLFWTFGAWGND